MNEQSMNVQGRGSDRGAVKIFLSVVAGAVLLGGFWTLLGPGLRLIGTWQFLQGGSSEIFRFDEDGSYWYRTQGGLLGIQMAGTYEVIQTSGETYRVHVKTEIGEADLAFRLESPDRLVPLTDSGEPENETPHRRVGDWVLARKPSSSSSAYDGARPHLGCWQRRGVETPALEILEGGTVLRYGGDEVERATYSVDYSTVPFRLTVTSGNGEVERGIFELTTDRSLRINRGQGNGEYPQKMNTYQDYVRCPQSPENDQGDHDVR